MAAQGQSGCPWPPTSSAASCSRIVTIWAITVVTFVIIQLPPGDFVDAYVAQASAMGSAISAAEAEALRQAYGLDQPIWVQYVQVGRR